VILDGAAVTQFEAAAAAAGDLGDDSFHVGPALTASQLDFGVGGPVVAGLAHEANSLVQNNFAASLGLGAPLAQRAVAAERTDPGSAERAGYDQPGSPPCPRARRR
jgi:hypothetical protein